MVNVTPFAVIHTSHNNETFVIHEACVLSGLSPNGIESMVFCISFLAKNGEPNEETKRIWISRDIMATWLATRTGK